MIYNQCGKIQPNQNKANRNNKQTTNQKKKKKALSVKSNPWKVNKHFVHLKSHKNQKWKMIHDKCQTYYTSTCRISFGRYVVPTDNCHEVSGSSLPRTKSACACLRRCLSDYTPAVPTKFTPFSETRCKIFPTFVGICHCFYQGLQANRTMSMGPPVARHF